MPWLIYNSNPFNKHVGDCVIRAISLALDQDWDTTYLEIMSQGFGMKDMPSSNAVWGQYLKNKGYKRHIIPDECPNCYTVSDFAKDHLVGTYILGTGTHVVTVKDGSYYDTWDSGNEIPVYYFVKESNNGI